MCPPFPISFGQALRECAAEGPLQLIKYSLLRPRSASPLLIHEPVWWEDHKADSTESITTFTYLESLKAQPSHTSRWMEVHKT